MFEDWESLLAVGVAVLIAYGAVLWLGIIVWIYRDIRERTRDTASQIMAGLLVVLFNIPGLFLYLILRPHETMIEAYERRLEGEALIRELAEQRRSCPSCDAPIREEFLLCPQCRTKLQEPCSGCDQTLELTWSACPYCGVAGPGKTVASEVPELSGTALSETAGPSAKPPSGQPDGQSSRPRARSSR